MVVLRRTRKLGTALPLSAGNPVVSETALGDWYVNRLTVDRRPLLLLVCSNALLPILLPARDVAKLADRLPDVVAARLQRLRIPQTIVDAEVAAMRPVVVAATADRSVLGIMVDFAKGVPYYLEPGMWDDRTLAFVEAHLEQTPCHAGTSAVVFPHRKAPELLLARWGPG